jgi:serine/threonine protein kinase
MGTSGYRAPELVRGIKKVFTNKVDIWAIGCIFYEMVFRRRAFYEDYATLNYSFDGTLYVPPMNSDNICEIISRDVLVAALEKLLNIDPKRRPTAIEIRQQFHSSGFSPARLFASDEVNTACVEPSICPPKEFRDYGVSAVATYRDFGVSTDASISQPKEYRDHAVSTVASTYRDFGVSTDLVFGNNENSYREDPARDDIQIRSVLEGGSSI